MTLELTEADFYPTLATVLPIKTQQNPTTITPKQLSIQERRGQVISLILQRMSVTNIAKKLGVDRWTIYEDFSEWAKTEQAQYLQVEWLQQYEQMKQDDPQTAFEALTKLMMKLLEKQAKLEVNLTQNNLTQIEIAPLTQYTEEDKSAILNAYRRLNKNGGSPPQPISIH